MDANEKGGYLGGRLTLTDTEIIACRSFLLVCNIDKTYILAEVFKIDFFTNSEKNTVACLVFGRDLGMVADAKTDKMLSMTRSDIIAALAVRFPHLTPKDAAISVKEILDAIGHSLSQGDRFEIRGFGSFGLNFRPARTGRNPKSGKAVLVAPKHVPHFKAGKAMRERVEASDRVKSIRRVA